MWNCPKCGEVHEDQFEICWKCASKEMEEHVVAGEPPRTVPSPAPEPRLRSGGSILLRMGIAFVVGAAMGGAAFYGFMPQTSAGGTILWYSGASGLAVAILVGIHFWVIFPYEPGHAPQSAEKKQDEPAS